MDRKQLHWVLSSNSDALGNKLLHRSAEGLQDGEIIMMAGIMNKRAYVTKWRLHEKAANMTA